MSTVLHAYQSQRYGVSPAIWDHLPFNRCKSNFKELGKKDIPKYWKDNAAISKFCERSYKKICTQINWLNQDDLTKISQEIRTSGHRIITEERMMKQQKLVITWELSAKSALWVSVSWVSCNWRSCLTTVNCSNSEPRDDESNSRTRHRSNSEEFSNSRVFIADSRLLWLT